MLENLLKNKKQRKHKVKIKKRKTEVSIAENVVLSLIIIIILLFWVRLQFCYFSFQIDRFINQIDKYQEKFFFITLDYDFGFHRKILFFQERKYNTTMCAKSTLFQGFITFFNTFLPPCDINIYCQLSKVTVDKYIYYSIYITGRNQK